MNVAEAIRQQAVLAAKIAKSEATDAERAEFDRVNAALAAPAPTSTLKTQLDTMTKAEFDAHMAAELSAVEKGAGTERLALLKQNIESVKRQAEAGKSVFAVALPVVEKVDPLAAALARIDELEKKFDSRFVTGVGQAKTPEPKAEPEPATPATVAADVAAGTDGDVAKAPAADEVDKGKPFPGAAPPFGADGKPKPDEELGPDGKPKKKAEKDAAEDVDKAGKPMMAPPSDQAPAASPEGDQAVDEEECKGCGKKKAKGAACPTCDKAAKEAGAPVEKAWGYDLASAHTPKSAVDAYRMMKHAR